MKTLLFAMAMVCIAGLPAGGAAAGPLYAVALEDGASLAAVELLGAAVRHVGLTEAVIEGGDRTGAELGASGVTARRLPAPRAEGKLFVCYPRVPLDRLADVGEVVWSESGGTAIVSCAEELVDELLYLSFSMHALPVSMDVGSWFDNTPPAHLLTRTVDDERAVRGVVSDVITSISPDSLMAHVVALSEYAGGESRTRFVFREECITEARAYIMDRLNEYLPARAVVDTQRFYIRGLTCEEGLGGPVVEYPADNVIATLPGTGDVRGCYVVCAHYDATATHEFPDPFTEPPWYWWCENPAPGADDNATGVATVLEAARALSGLTFPFDIRFVLFSGEELGLHGSIAYADSVAGYRAAYGDFVAPPDTIFGVLNVDMIAYKREPGYKDTCHFVANSGSVWLADWIVDTAESEYPGLFPDFDAVTIEYPHNYSDHASFWARDYDAIMAIESTHDLAWNPNYHTTEDLAGVIYPSQLASATRALTGALARMADPDGQFNLAVFADDVLFYATSPGGIEYHTDHFVIGEPAPVRVDFHAFGPEGSVDVTLEVWDGPPDDGTLISTGYFAGDFGGGQVLTHEFDWDLGDGDLGDHVLSVRLVSAGDPELTLADNTVTGIPVRIDAPSLFLADHFPWPNPATDLGELNFSYRLSRASEGSVEIKVFDLLGEMVAESLIYYSSDPAASNDGLLPGMNTIPWGTIGGGGVSLSSGVYIYQITVYDEGSAGPDSQVTGKFAIAR